MGLYINQQNSRTKLQEKIAAELRAKAAQVQNVGGDAPDGVEDSAYLERTKNGTTISRMGVLAIIIAGLFIVLLATAK
jgi:ribose 5-phosphate isomerase RpiB